MVVAAEAVLMKLARASRSVVVFIVSLQPLAFSWCRGEDAHAGEFQVAVRIVVVGDGGLAIRAEGQRGVSADGARAVHGGKAPRVAIEAREFQVVVREIPVGDGGLAVRAEAQRGVSADGA